MKPTNEDIQGMQHRLKISSSNEMFETLQNNGNLNKSINYTTNNNRAEKSLNAFKIPIKSSQKIIKIKQLKPRV